MTLPATPASSPLPAPVVAIGDERGGIRARAAEFWLGALFALAGRAPWITRALRGVVPWGAYLSSPTVRRVTDANARRILGPSSTPARRRRYARGVVASFYDFVCDVGRSSRMTREQLAARIESAEGHDAYCRTRAGRRGAIVVTAHMGSFEVGMVGLLSHEPRIHVVFKRDPSRFERLRSSLRQRLGVIEAPVDEGLGLWVRLRDALLADEVVVLQGDRVMPGQRGRPVAMLGGHVMLPTGPVKLALATGAPIVPIFSIRTPGGRVRIVIDEPIEVAGADDVDAALARVAAAVERQVRAHPEQWLVLHRAFCEDRDQADAPVEPVARPARS